MEWRKESNYLNRLNEAGLSRKINTSFVERVNLTLRHQCVVKLTRRTWGPVKVSTEFMGYLNWWRAYYHFRRYHESLAATLTTPSGVKKNNSLSDPTNRIPRWRPG
jgi:hypothetical protein